MSMGVITRRIVPGLILAFAAAAGVGGGILTCRALEENEPEPEAVDPEGLLYFADQIIWDDDLTRPHLLPGGVRVGQLARKADGGWILKEERRGARARLVMQDPDNRRYGGRRIPDVAFDVSYDRARLVYPDGDRAVIVDTSSGKTIDTVDVGLATVNAAFFSGDNVLASGVNSAGNGQVVLWDAARETASPLRLGIDGDVRLVDVSASGVRAAVQAGPAGACVAIFAVSQPGQAIWRDDECRFRAYPDALSPDGSRLITYPDTGTPVLPGRVIVTDLEHPEQTVTIGDGKVADAGWTDDGQLVVIAQHNTEPMTFEVRYCVVDGTCVSELGTRGAVAKVGRVD